MHFLKNMNREKNTFNPALPLYHNSLCHLAGVGVWEPLPGPSHMCSCLSALSSWMSHGLSNRTCPETNSSFAPKSCSRPTPLLSNGTIFHPGAQGECLRVTLDSSFPSPAHPVLQQFLSPHLQNISPRRPGRTILSCPHLAPVCSPSLYPGPTVMHSLRRSWGALPTMQSRKSSLCPTPSADFPLHLRSEGHVPQQLQQGPARSGLYAYLLNLLSSPVAPLSLRSSHSDLLAIPGDSKHASTASLCPCGALSSACVLLSYSTSSVFSITSLERPSPITPLQNNGLTPTLPLSNSASFMSSQTE